MKKLLVLLAGLTLTQPAFAGSSTVAITPGSGANVAVTTDAGSNINWRNTVWDYSAAANGWSIDSSHNGGVAINEWGGSTLGSPSNYGTSPGAVTVQGVNAYVTNTVAVSDSTTHTDLGTINTTLGSPFQAGGSIGNTGFNALQSGSATSTSNPFYVAQSSAAWTVQPGNTPNTSPWLFTINQGGNSASVTAGNALKVDASATTQPISGTVTANEGNAPWTQNVTQWNSVALGSPTAWGVAPSGNVIGVNANVLSNVAPANSSATGSITSTQSVTLNPTPGQSSVGVQVSGTWNGTLVIEGTVDGTNWIATTLTELSSGSVQASSITQNGVYQGNIAGLAGFRLRGNSVSSGTAVVTLTGAAGIATVMADNPFQVIGIGTAGSPSGGVITVQGATSMTPVTVNQTTASNLNAQVVGAAANGSVPSGNPVQIAGWDGTDIRTISTTSSGAVNINGTITTSIGTFTPAPSSATLSVSSSSSNVQLPTNTGTVVVYNSVSGVPVITKLGNSGVSVTATTGDIIQPGCWLAYSPGSGQTYIAGITSSSTSTLQITGGSGIPTGGCASTFSGSIGSVTQGTSPWVDNITQIGGSSLALGQTTMSASLPVAIASDQSKLNVTANGATQTSATLQSSAVANGNGTSLGVSGYATATLTVNCSGCSGGTTINFEGTEDGTNFSALSAIQLGTTTIATTTTAAGVALWRVGTAGLQSIRARISSYSAGTITVTGHANPETHPDVVENVNVVSSNTSTNLAQVNGTTVLVNTGAVGAGAQRVAVGQDTATIAGSAPGTAGTASSNVVSIQGIASMTPVLVNPGTAANWGVGATGSSVPANAFYNSINVSGTLRGWTGVNPSGSIYAGQMDIASVGGNTVTTGGTNGSVGVGGLAASGSAVAGNPVLVGGSDGTDARSLATDASGHAIVTQIPATSGGATPFHLIAAASTNATNIKSSAGQVYGIQVYSNASASTAYLKFYNVSGSPTCNSSTVVKTIQITGGGGSNVDFPAGLAFSTGIGICVTAGISDTDNTNVAASTFTIGVDYK